MSDPNVSEPASEPVPTETHGAPVDSSTGQLISRASEQLGTLVRTEMELARAELSETVKRAGLGAGLFGTAGVVALYAVGCAVATAILALSLVLDAWLATLIVTVVLAAVAGGAALVGKRQVSQAAPPVQHSVASVKRDIDAVKNPDQQPSTTEQDRR